MFMGANYSTGAVFHATPALSVNQPTTPFTVMATTDGGLHFNLDNVNDDNERYDDDLVNLKNCLNNCVYYTDSEVNNLHQQLCRDITLSTLTVNCRSLPKHFDKLEYTIKSLDFNFDCIGLTET